jgi:carbon-monoxide dehydrogenase medium subunit
MYQTALEPDELLVELEVPVLPAGFTGSYLRVQRLQRPTLGVAVAARVENERLGDIRLAVGCIGPKAERLRELETRLIGASLIDAERIIRESKPYLADLLRPVEDLLGSVNYKLYLTQILLQRGLKQAVHGNGGRDSNG